MTLPLLKAPPQSICLLRLSAIGDVTHVVPVVRILQEKWPNATITWIIGKTESTLVGDIPGVEFIVFDKNHNFSSYQILRRKLKGRRFDILLHMQISLRASLASLMVRAPIRIGFDKSRAKNGQWLFTNSRVAGNSRQHVLDGFLEFVRVLGINNPHIKWDIPIPQKAREKIKLLIDTDRPYMVINPSSSVRVRNYRNWDAQAYAKIAEYVFERYGLQTVLTGGPSKEEKAFARSINELSEVEITNLVGKTSLKELLALLDQATLAISPDTGPAHMANATGTPIVGLYASSNPDRTGPYSFRKLVVNRYPEAIKKKFNKSVNELPWGKRVRDPLVMSLIPQEEVQEKIDQVLGDNKENKLNTIYQDGQAAEVAKDQHI